MSVLRLAYGHRQRFRPHHEDINLIGRVDAPLPVREAISRVNGGLPQPFYVDPLPDPGLDFSYQYKDSPARLRLVRAGDFNVEIPHAHAGLRAGENTVTLRVVDAGGVAHEAGVTVAWDPRPVRLPVDAVDLSAVTDIQHIGQVVDGAFDVDPFEGVIRTRGRAKPDSLLLLGGPAGSQEATYAFRYFDGSRSKYIGLSDFFVRHEVEDPDLPIKPGWSTAGLATLRPRGEFEWEARIWIAVADRPGWRPVGPDDQAHGREFSVVRTDPPARFIPMPDVAYRVRHQVLLDGSCNRARFRIWPAGEPEPDAWLCDESTEGTSTVAVHRHATFGLFMHSGISSEWWDIRLRSLD
jgi:hypothetical protein